jgi:AcrR family transcriptional regulator
MNTEYVSPIRQDYLAQTRERILDSAMAAIQKEGLETQTIAQVAKDAGITDRTVYRHFQTRQDLLKAVWGADAVAHRPVRISEDSGCPVGGTRSFVSPLPGQ